MEEDENQTEAPAEEATSEEAPASDESESAPEAPAEESESSEDAE